MGALGMKREERYAGAAADPALSSSSSSSSALPSLPGMDGLGSPPLAKISRPASVADRLKLLRRMPDEPDRFYFEDLQILYEDEACFVEQKADELGCALEQTGNLTFEMVINDFQAKGLFNLLCLRNVYGRQLPNMPKEYITQLVFDPRHRSIAAKWNQNIIGGITFRPFYTKHCNFGEIAFCAVYNHMDPDQRGVGARMMQHLKLECLKIGIDNFLTYADDTAIGFFSKMGFTLKIGLPHEHWKGYIKDYDKATLMHCRFRTGIDYTKMPDIVHAQRQAILDKFPRYTERTPQVLALSRPEVTPDMVRTLFEEVWTHEHSWPFKQPVQEIVEAYPTYGDTIKNPLDLLIVRDRVERRDYYRTWWMFVADMVLMLKNCQRFNGEQSDYTKVAGKFLEALRLMMARRGAEHIYHTVEKGLRYVYDPELARRNKRKQ